MSIALVDDSKLRLYFDDRNLCKWWTVTAAGHWRYLTDGIDNLSHPLKDFGWYSSDKL